MNKKDVANVRKQFKADNDRLTIHEIFNVYIMKETNEIYHHQSMPFEMLEAEQQELFYQNFKKVLTGQLDEKLFELKFKRDVENSSQLILHQGLLAQETDAWKADMLKLVEKMLSGDPYDVDIVVTFIKAEFRDPSKQVSEEAEESSHDKMYAHPFILCSVNKTQDPKKELLFDYVEKEFKYNFVVDPVINLQAPISGFLFPAITDNASDVNHVLYSTGKANALNEHFIDDVLNAEEAVTAEEDKAVFEEVLKRVAGEQINTRTLSNVYEEVNRVVEEHEEDETPTLDYKDIGQVFENSGVKEANPEKVQEAFKSIIDDESYELKASSVVPKSNSKSIKIKTKVADIALKPEDLKYVRQTIVGGKLNLMIEVEENTVVEGFEMIPEALMQKAEDEQ
ncbi:DUF4317 domain-containing protein [Alkalibacillus salilacus]|uniref:DUF4317 family protein n=1 Tax=Alkalibacillus salilacus TaxID=284582 RepID=A0ABT9VFV8_9BACI|nr:DUF4317 domain-containing protein [Alkalibacillus salilacus]MDQ0159865.1 hypothetical protein [Alkalibacillus salilacus]